MFKNEIFVRFVVRDYNEKILNITKELGIEPSKAWKKNELKTGKGSAKYKTNSWEFHIVEKNVLHVEDVLKKLIDTLLPVKKQISSFENVKKTISIVVYSYQNMPSITLDLKCIEFIHYIKANLEQDVYCL